MAGLGLSVGPGFLLLAAFLYYEGGWAAVTAFCTAALSHELGHLAAMTMTGASVRSVKLTAAGPVIELCGDMTPRQELGITAAGPLAGILFSLLCLSSGSLYFRYTGLIALLASAFNLLPVLPLDGGRLATAALRSVMPEKTASHVLRALGSLLGFGVTVTGLRAGSVCSAAVGIWLAVLANVPELR